MEILLTLIVGAVIGALAAYVVSARKGRQPTPDAATTDAQLEALETKMLQAVNKSFMETSKHLREQSQADLQQRQASIADLVKPIKDALSKSEQQVREIEKERKQDLGSLRQHLEQVTRGQQQLQTETTRLVQALKKPQVRGRWGELTLRRTVELAGMVEHCDFDEQAGSTSDEGRRLRPDMVVHLPNERRVVVDAKTPLDAYLAAIEADSEGEREAQLQRHTEQVKAKVKDLTSKAYWRQFEDTLDFVVMFVPGEQFLAAALERDPALQENALRDRVILATPPTLVALLRAIAYGWRQKSLEENAQEIRKLGEELHDRAATFAEHLARIGKSLGGSVSAYNAAVGSLERSLLPGARKFTELGIQKKKEIPEAKPVETSAREVAALPAAEPAAQTASEEKSAASSD